MDNPILCKFRLKSSIVKKKLQKGSSVAKMANFVHDLYGITLREVYYLSVNHQFDHPTSRRVIARFSQIPGASSR
jgi:hypothetical protein